MLRHTQSNPQLFQPRVGQWLQFDVVCVLGFNLICPCTSHLPEPSLGDAISAFGTK